MYSFSNFEPVCFPISNSNCCFLTCLQISQEADKVILYTHLFKNFPQFIVIPTVKGFGEVNKTEVNFFFFFPGTLLLSQWSNRCWQVDLCFLCLLKSSLNICKFLVHILLKPPWRNLNITLPECSAAAAAASAMSDSVGSYRWQPTRLPDPGMSAIVQ